MESLLQEIGTLIAVNFAVAIGAVIVLWLISIPIRDASIIDMFFAVILFAITVVSFVLGGGAENRKLLVLVLVGLWALRITVHLIKRNWGHGEDRRYTKLRGWVKDDRSFNWLSLRKVFLLQGMVLWVTSFPVQAAMVFEQPATLGWPALAGIALWIVGFLFEAISDVQVFGPMKASGERCCKPGCGSIHATPTILASCASGGACFWWLAIIRQVFSQSSGRSYIPTWSSISPVREPWKRSWQKKNRATVNT
jgi:hypothetical protein